MSLRLPESLHKQLRELAKKVGMSIDQLATTALAEKMAALMTSEYLEQRGSRDKFEDAMAKVKDVEPEPSDARTESQARG